MRQGIRPAAVAGIVVLCIVVVTGALYAFLSFNARRIFNAKISSLTRSHVEARVVRAEFPATLVVEGLSIDGLLTCAQARASVDLFSLLGRDIRILELELVRPVLMWEYQASGAAGSSSVQGDAGNSADPAVRRNVILGQLRVHDVVVKVMIKSETGGSKEYVVDGVQLRARNVPLTDTPARTEFFLTASLVKLNVPFAGHFLKASGWLNWAAKDMESVAQVIDDNGRVGLDVRMLSMQNDMNVTGHVKLSGGQEPQAEGKKSGLVENVVLNMLLSTNTDLTMGFSFRTKMDHVELGAVNLTGQITTGLNSSSTSGNIVAGLKTAGEELLKATEDVNVQK